MRSMLCLSQAAPTPGGIKGHGDAVPQPPHGIWPRPSLFVLTLFWIQGAPFMSALPAMRGWLWLVGDITSESSVLHEPR